MANIQLTQQQRRLLTQHAGEYRVASELCRRNVLATTFAGNMAGFDVLAMVNGTAVKVQVKASSENAKKWMAKVSRYVEPNGRLKKLAEPDMRWVIVDFQRNQDADFYVLTHKQVQKVVQRIYKEKLKTGNRPQTVHPAMSQFANFKDNWKLITDIS